MKIGKEIDVSLTSDELAELFSSADDEEQANFLSAVVDNFDSWGNESRQFQLMSIAEKLCHFGNSEKVEKFLFDLINYIRE